jgi:hypothetical protein
MDQGKDLATVYPAGEHASVAASALPGAEPHDTFAGVVQVAWDRSCALTPFGQAVYFIEFLKVSGVFDALLANCPLHYTSPNAPDVRAVAGTWVLSVLAGHRRYAHVHVTALRSDSVLPELMAMRSAFQSPRNRQRAYRVMPLLYLMST